MNKIHDLRTDIMLVAVICSFLCMSLKNDSDPEKSTAVLLNNPVLQELGQKLFFDARLSTPEGQSCAACHGPDVGWTGPDEQVNKGGGVYPGAVHTRFGNRKPNSAAYATFSPCFSLIHGRW